MHVASLSSPAADATGLVTSAGRQPTCQMLPEAEQCSSRETQNATESEQLGQSKAVSVMYLSAMLASLGIPTIDACS